MSRLTKPEQETIINYDNATHTASVYTHDARLLHKLEKLASEYPEQFKLERTYWDEAACYTIPKSCVSIRPPYSEDRRVHQQQNAKANGLPWERSVEQ